MAPGRSRVFFALWPDAGVRRLLQAETRRLHSLLGGRATQADTLHLTLVFVGDVDDSRLPDLRVVADRVRVPAFDLLLDKSDCWRHNRIAFLGPSLTPQPLRDLVAQLEANLGQAGLPFDARPYRAHVTLVRKADCGAREPEKENPSAEEPETRNPALGPIPWPVRDFVLVRSSLRPEGGRYEQLGRWPLL